MTKGIVSAAAGAALLALSSTASAYVWLTAVPTEVHIVPDGLVVMGFNVSSIACATNGGIFLPSAGDNNFDRKVAVAMTAFAMERPLTVLINDPVNTNCNVQSAIGALPIAYSAYWIMKKN
jgi:hypothetical protein